MKIIETDFNYKILVCDDNISLYENKEYSEGETPYYFKEAYLPLDITLEYCMNKYLEILDTDKIIPIIEKHKPIK